MVDTIEELNSDPAVHGIMVQLPLDTDNKIDAHVVRHIIVINLLLGLGENGIAVRAITSTRCI